MSKSKSTMAGVIVGLEAAAATVSSVALVLASRPLKTC